MSFVCLNCENEYDVTLLKSTKGGFICPNKFCKSALYEVDTMLLPIVFFLYKKGFKILSSSVSKLSDSDMQDVKISLKLCRYVKGLYLTEKHIKELFEYIDKYTNIVYNENTIIVIFERKNLDLRGAYSYLFENCMILLDWCEKVIKPLCEDLDSSWCEGEEVNEDIDISYNLQRNNLKEFE